VAKENKDFSYKQLENGQFFTIDPDVVKISFDNNRFFFEFGKAEEKKKEADDVALASSLRVAILQESVLGLSDVMIKAYAEYTQKHPEDESKHKEKEE
jgi:hypothetical protein